MRPLALLDRYDRGAWVRPSLLRRHKDCYCHTERSNSIAQSSVSIDFFEIRSTRLLRNLGRYDRESGCAHSLRSVGMTIMKIFAHRLQAQLTLKENKARVCTQTNANIPKHTVGKVVRLPASSACLFCQGFKLALGAKTL